MDANAAAESDSTPRLLNGFLDKAELAAELGVSPRTVDRWRDQPNGLPFVKLGARCLFRIESVRSWLTGRERQRNTRRRAT